VLEPLETKVADCPHPSVDWDQIRRLVCRFFGHRKVWFDDAAPVTEFWACTRCRKWWR
jgi:hypothetical protein